VKIVDVLVRSFSHPMPPLHGDRFGGTQEISLVTVQTDVGIEGHAMARAQGGASGAPIGEHVARSAKPLVVGENPLDRERLWRRLFALERGMYAPIFVTSAIDVALWDIAGKAMGQPVYRVLGGFRDRVPSYASSAHLPSIDAYVDDARAAFAAGFRAYKIHPFGAPDRDIALCEAVRAAFPSARLMLDVTGAYRRSDALRVGRALERLDFHWYEEPLSHYDLEGNRALRDALDIPVIGAETIGGSAFSGAAYAAAGAFDAILCDVYWKMGISGMMKLVHACEALNVDVASHHAASALMNVANLHCLAATPSAEMIEVLVPTERYEYGLASYPRLDADGCLPVPDGPGLGVEPDWAYIEANATSRF
jgi:L-alanine-DL-glutamate epimerase-like enolase superfamily enzyme